MSADREPGGVGRVMVRLPDKIRNDVFLRAARNRRSMSSEMLVLIEAGLAAEKMASNHTA